MSLNRRQLLMFFGATAGTVALGSFSKTSGNGLGLGAQAASASSGVAFKPVRVPMPIATAGVAPEQQATEFATYVVKDDLVLPEGYTYNVIGAWGDPVGDSRFGFNNDYLSYVETSAGEGFLSINFEYISALTWMETYQPVLGKELPFDEVKAAAEAAGEDGIDVYSLPDSDPIKAQIQAIAEEALIDLGIGVISIRKTSNGTWERTNSNADRRITGVSGLKDGRYLKATGPATAIFRKTSGVGYIDGLGERIIGTFNNCAGGTTPWGTMFSAEENFQDFVPEPVNADGTSMSPSKKPFFINPDGFDGLGTAFGFAGNKYGWMVEVDPSNPNDYGTKHTWLGRYRHEAVGVRAVAGQKLAMYSGCDRRGGHLYKFVSAGTVTDPTAKSNSGLLADGMLYAAKFNPDGTGRWIALKADTPVNPDLPSQIEGGLITLPNRPDGGVMKVETDEQIAAFKSQFKTLGDLYTGNATEKQGAILIDAHYAGNAAGATTTARPEDTMVRADGTLFIAFTSGSPSSSDGGPHKAVFQGPNGESPYEYGWIMKLREDSNDAAAMTFSWEVLHVGGEPALGGVGFANPDNFQIDARNDLWMVTDMSSDKHNRAVPSRIDDEGKPVSQSNLRGLFGNNSIWYMPLEGANAGESFVFGYGPMECEMTGPFTTNDMKTLFISAQHPGEINGIRKDMAAETRAFALMTTDGKDFVQQREVPIGSNWPTKTTNAAPRPAVVAIRRVDGGELV